MLKTATTHLKEKNNWTTKSFGDFLTLEYGKPLKENNRNGGDIPVYGSNGIVGFHDEKLVDGPGIIVGRKGSAGEIIFSDTDFYPIDTTYFVKTDLNKKFVYYLLKYFGLKRLVSSSAVPGLNRNDLYSQEIEIPEKNSEQDKIAEILSSVDDKIELNRKINLNLEKLADTIFKKWFIEDRAEGWNITNIGSVVTEDKNAIVDGPFGTQMKISEYTDHGIPIVEMEYLEGYPFYRSFSNYISEQKYQEVKRSTVLDGDIVISKTGTLGLLGIMTNLWDRAVLVSRLAKITPNLNKVNRYYLFQVLKNFQKEKYWDSQSSGSTMPIINLTHIKSAEFILPPIELQNKYGQIVENFYQIIHNNLLEIQNLSDIRDSLLSRLMSGKIRVN